MLVVGAAWLAFGGDTSRPDPSAGKGDPAIPPAAPSPGATVTGDGALPGGGPLTASATKSVARPAVKDTPAPPSAGVPQNGKTPSDEQRAYLEQTRAVVTTNTPALNSAVAQIVAAIGSGDAGALSATVAPDEGDAASFSSDLASRYPTIIESSPSANINVFTSGEATLYFAYTVVTWEDAGIVSQHTIPIILRFVDGQWYLSTLGDGAADLQFVQSVTL